MYDCSRKGIHVPRDSNETDSRPVGRGTTVGSSQFSKITLPGSSLGIVPSPLYGVERGDTLSRLRTGLPDLTSTSVVTPWRSTEKRGRVKVTRGVHTKDPKGRVFIRRTWVQESSPYGRPPWVHCTRPPEYHENVEKKRNGGVPLIYYLEGITHCNCDLHSFFHNVQLIRNRLSNSGLTKTRT